MLILIRKLKSRLNTSVAEMPELGKIVTNMSWLLSDRILRMGGGLLVGVWFARYLGPESFGIWNFAQSLTVIFSVFATIGLDGIVIRQLIHDPDRRDQWLGSALLLKGGGSLCAFALSVFAVSIFGEPDKLQIQLVAIMAAAFFVQPFDVIDLYFQSKTFSKYTVIGANIAFTFATIFKIVLILIGAPILAFAWVVLAEAMLKSLFFMWSYQWHGLSISKWRPNLQVARSLLSESWPLLLSGLAVLVYMRIDVVMLQQLTNGHEVGIYSAAVKVSELWYFIPGIIIASVSPSIIEVHGSDSALFIKRLRRLYAVLAVLALGMAAPLSLLSDFTITLLFGEEYREAGPVLAMHIWAGFAVFLGMASSQYLLVEKLQKIALYRTVIGMFSNIIINLLLIPHYGAFGAAIATVISYFVATYSIVFFRSTRGHVRMLLFMPMAPASQ